jgi:general secretion pathway protein G
MSTRQTLPARQRRKGFTLIELMVVIVILGIIGTMAFVFLLDEPDRARWERARTEMGQIQNALNRYHLDHGEYPETLEAVADRFNNRVPRDPFTREPYEYRRTERGFELRSLGADGVEGGEEIPDRDIIFNERGQIEDD